MARRLCRHSAGLRLFRLLLWVVAFLCGGAGLLAALLGKRSGGSMTAGLGYLLFAALVGWFAADGLCRARAALLLRRFRLEKRVRRRYEIFDDGIWDESLPPDGLPYSFARYRHFSQDSRRFYLLRDGECFTFDKRSFTTGDAAEFALFMRVALRDAAALYGDEEE